MGVSIATLGQLSILREGQVLSGPGAQPRRLAMLALLVRAGERGISRDRLVAMLWPDADEERGRRAVTQALYSLRRELGSDDAIGGAKELRLDPQLVSSDLWEFEESVKREVWSEAAGRYGGPFLDGFKLPGAAEFERWCESERNALAHEYARVLERAAEASAAAGDHDAAIRWWRRLAAHDPFNARVATSLMRALASSGDTAGAIRHASVYRTLMEAELELPPDPTVVSLAEELRREPALLRSPTPVREAPAFIPSPDSAVERALVTEPAPRVDSMAAAPRGGSKALIGALALVAVAAAWGSAALRARRPPLEARRVIIAPLENRTGDRQLDLVGAMVAEWVTQGVARTELVEVVDARTMLSSARDVELSGSPRYLRTLAEENGAGIAVSGSFYRDGDSLRFQMQISEPRSGSVRQSIDLVSAPVARPTEALEPITERVMGALAVLLDARLHNATVATSQPPTYEAYRHFLLGMQSFGSDFETEYAHFIRAAELDTSYAQAVLWAGIASANLRVYPRADSLLATLDDARERLAPYDQANLEYFYRGFVQGSWPASHAGARRMLQLAPNAGHAHYAVGFTAIALGRPEEALEALLSVDLERGWGRSWAPQLINLITRAYHQLGRHEAELEWAQRLRRIDPGQGWLRVAEGRALAALGRVSELEQRLDEGLAFAATERGWEPYSPGAFALLAARELAAHGQPRHADSVATRAVAWYASRPSSERETPQARRALATALYQSGRIREAEAVHRALVAEGIAGMGEFGALGVIAAREGRLAEAAAWTDSVAAIPGPYRFGNGFYWQARIAARAGRRDEAVQLIGQSLRDGLGRHHQIHAEPDFQSLRDHPAFRELLVPRR
jgi:DNA-binding SARP family transcriptional activator/tetratricopeptide (TPR) repeat protein/TolB-like protein